jgi:alkylhydroperoxidase/carboxymuconolactone decarboxylase family protein YurZ
VTPDEVREVLLAVSGLAGGPAAWTALEVAKPILDEHEAKPDDEEA